MRDPAELTTVNSVPPTPCIAAASAHNDYPKAATSATERLRSLMRSRGWVAGPPPSPVPPPPPGAQDGAHVLVDDGSYDAGSVVVLISLDGQVHCLNRYGE